MKGSRQGLRLGVIAVVLAMAATAVAAGSDYSIESSTNDALPGLAGDAGAICPAGSSLTGGGWETDAFREYYLQRWAPFSKRGFAVTIINNSTHSETFNLTAYGVCDETGRYSRESASKNLADGETRTVTARCPRGTHISGGGGQLGGDNFGVLASKPRGARAWQVRASQTGPDRKLYAVAVCDHSAGDYSIRARTQQAPPARAHARGLTGTFVLPVTANCRRGEKVTGGGWSLTPPVHALDGSFPGKADHAERIPGQAWTTRFFTHEGDPTKFTSYAVCKHV